MPRHINPTSKDRNASAPYNFVPLPNRIFTVADGIEVNAEKIKPWEMHDRFVSGTHSGWIDLTIETLTPLFIRGAAAQDTQGSWDTREARLRPDPYARPDGTPVIPGSSLRGMVRTLVEILSFSKIRPVTKAKPFFRTVANDRIGRAYRTRMMRGGQKPRGGILAIRNGVASISPREVVRVLRSKLPQEIRNRIGNGRDPNYTPPWPQQHGPCWVQLSDGSNTVNEIHVGEDRPQGISWRRGTLVLTGNAPGKKREFVFLDPDGSAQDEIVVPESIWERFHDDDQITQWQERAFPADRPRHRCRKANGHLRDGEPVFFLTDDNAKSDENPDGLVFLGRAQMFRFPYDLSPADLVPEELRTAGLDLAEAIFGKVGPSDAIKGRVQFEDAVATTGGPDWYERVLVPQILSAPKPTTFQHYLTQHGKKGRDQLTTYLKGDHTTIRGHKLYWHRWDDKNDISQVTENTNHDSILQDLRQQSPNDTQHTVIRPVKAGVTFSGRIRFENLTDLELGALLEALQLPDGCCHRLGMGKPLGLGSIRITSTLRLVDRASRYRTWQATGIEESEDGRRFRKVFVETMLDHARASNETLLPNQQGLRQIGRLDALYLILTWSRRPGRSSTDYMGLARFRERPVLPTPHMVVRSQEPPWPDDPPRPGSGPGDDAGSGDGPRVMSREPRPVAAPSSAPAVKPVQKGQIRRGVLKRRGDRWVATFEGDPREAQIVNPRAIPDHCTEGTAAEFYITEQSKRGGIKARFERLEES